MQPGTLLIPRRCLEHVTFINAYTVKYLTFEGLIEKTQTFMLLETHSGNSMFYIVALPNGKKVAVNKNLVEEL